MNNADYGLSMQKLICDMYEIEINDWAKAQFNANYNDEYEKELKPIIGSIFKEINAKPVKLLTYSKEMTTGKQTISPHNFLLDNGSTLSIRTVKNSNKVAPKTVGQAGYKILNEYFEEIYGNRIETQEDIKKLVYENIHKMLPVFIENLFQSNYTVILSRKNGKKIQVINASDVTEYSFARADFTFTRNLENWKESTTLKYYGKSIAEIQTHKERSFKFRFIISNMSEWFYKVKENNETLGISAEAAVCDYFLLEKPINFKNRVLQSYVKQLQPIIAKAFESMPPAVRHTGSLTGSRGKQSKCSYDFILEGELTLSLKTNKGKMVCPPEVGQPGSKTCLLYFARFFEENIKEVTGEKFKEMVLNNIEKIIPIYVDHLFDSDWLLWIYETKNGYDFQNINKNNINKYVWEKERFSFTKKTIAEWNESNTVKYDGITIGEFQIHKNRNCYKFRFNMRNLLDIILK